MVPGRRNLVFVSLYLSAVENWIEPIRPFLTRAGYRIHIIHIQRLSYGSPSSFARLKNDYTLHEADTGNVGDVNRILTSINPVAVGFLGFQSLFEILLCQICKDYGIRTFYMQHGHFSEQTFRFLLANKTSSVRRYTKLLSLLRQYAGSETGNLKKGVRLLKAFAKRQYHDIHPDHALLFAPSSYESFNPRFGFTEENVHYCGFPLFSKSDDLDTSTPTASNHALYIHQAFIRNGQTNLSYEQETGFLTKLADAVAAQGCSFSVRLHPREDRVSYENRLGDRVAIDEAPSLIEAIQRSSVVVGQSSTALFGAVLLEKPIVLVSYPGIPDSTGSIFSDIAVSSNDAQEAAQVIGRNGDTSKLEAYQSFRERYIGQKNSHEHWAQTIEQIASEQQQ